MSEIPGGNNIDTNDEAKPSVKKRLLYGGDFDDFEKKHPSVDKERDLDQDSVELKVKARFEAKSEDKSEAEKKCPDYIKKRIKPLLVKYSDNLNGAPLDGDFAITMESLTNLIPKEPVRKRVIAALNLKEGNSIDTQKLLAECIFQDIITELEKNNVEAQDTLTDKVNTVTSESKSPEDQVTFKKKQATIVLFQKLKLLPEGEIDPNKDIDFKTAWKNLNDLFVSKQLSKDEFFTQYAQALGKEKKTVWAEFTVMIEKNEDLAKMVAFKEIVDKKGLHGQFLKAVDDDTIGEMFTEHLKDFKYELSGLKTALVDYEREMEGQKTETKTETTEITTPTEIPTDKINKSELIRTTPSLKTAPPFLQKLIRGDDDTTVDTKGDGHVIKLPEGLDTTIDIQPNKMPVITLLPGTENEKKVTVENFTDLEGIMERSNAEDYIRNLNLRNFFGDGPNAQQKMLEQINIFRRQTTPSDEADDNNKLFNKVTEDAYIRPMLRDTLNVQGATFSITEDLLDGAGMLNTDGSMKNANEQTEFMDRKKDYDNNLDNKQE